MKSENVFSNSIFKKKDYSFWVLAILILLLLSSCKSIEPLPPQNQIVEPSISKPKVSAISIPIEVNLDTYFKEADKAIPKVFTGGEKLCEGLSYNYELNRDPIKFNTFSSGIEYTTTVNYKLDLSYCPKCTDIFNDKGNCIVPRFFGSCGINESLRRADISFSTALELLPSYALKAKTTLKSLNLVDPCKITLVNYDITTLLDKEIRKEAKSIVTEIDKEINAIDLKSSCVFAWEELQKDIPIGSYGFLQLSPNSISLSQLHFNKNKLNFNLGIELFPTVKTDKSINKPKSLPNLTEIKQKEGFEMNVDLSLSYDSLTSWIGGKLNKTVLDISNRKIIIDSIQFIGADGRRILLGLNFYGFRKGKLFFSAQPILDKEKQLLNLTDIQLDVKTKDILITTAKWLLNNQICKKIEEKSVFELRPYLLEVKKEIATSLNQDLQKNVHLKGQVDNLELNELFPLKDKLFVRSTIIGKLKLNID